MRHLLAAAVIGWTVPVGLCGQDESASAGGFAVGRTDIGPIVGLGGIGQAGIAVGIRGERGVADLPDLGDGVLGIQVGADYYRQTLLDGAAEWTHIPIGATANYHFRVEDAPRVDPFLGLGLGYSVLSCSGTACGTSAVYLIGRAGIRYYFRDAAAIYGAIGAGAATLHAGVMFVLP